MALTLNHLVPKMSNTVVWGFSTIKVLYLPNLLRTQVGGLRREKGLSVLQSRAVRGLATRSKKLVSGRHPQSQQSIGSPYGFLGISIHSLSYLKWVHTLG